jgi:hypothetical protein
LKQEARIFEMCGGKSFLKDKRIKGYMRINETFDKTVIYKSLPASVGTALE